MNPCWLRKTFWRACLCSLALACSVRATPQSDDDCWSKDAIASKDSRLDPIRETMKRRIVDGSGGSVAVAVALDGKIIWEEACGFADREHLVGATPDTLYDVGSISKTFTATGLMTLVEKHLVDLSRPANDYLGGVKLTGLGGDASRATVRLVMQHRAGLPQHYQFIYESEAYRRPTMEETLSRYGIIVRPPGEAYHYANMDYGVVEYILSQVSGLSYENFMKRDVFVPLGLTHTSVGLPPELKAVAAALYNHGKRLPFMDFDQRGAGYIYSSAHDLVRFGMFHLKEHLPAQRQVLKDSTIDSMVSDAVPVDPMEDVGLYGLGWGIRPNEYGPGLTRVRHLGGMPGSSAALVLIPSRRIAVAVVANSEDEETFNLSDEIVMALVPDHAAQRSKQLAQTTSSPGAFLPTIDYVGTWKGSVKTWTGELPIRMEIKPGGDIHVQLADQLETLLDKVVFSNGNLTGSFQGTIPTPDADRERHTVLLDQLVLRGNTLSGAALAEAESRYGHHYGLPSWIKLVRQVQGN